MNPKTRESWDAARWSPSTNRSPEGTIQVLWAAGGSDDLDQASERTPRCLAGGHGRGLATGRELVWPIVAANHWICTALMVAVPLGYWPWQSTQTTWLDPMPPAHTVVATNRTLITVCSFGRQAGQPLSCQLPA